MADRYHPWAWIGWLGATLVILSVTRNPLYLALTLACIGIVAAARRDNAHSAPIPLSPVRFGIIVITLSAIFNAVSVHAGRTILFELPGWLPLIGGSVTLEALVYGALNGVALTGIFAAFTVLNQVLPVRALVRLIPRAFYQVAVVVSIAVTYVPTTLRQFQQIREAQAVRGHRIRGLRDWLPLLMPLLIGGLERALQLSEAMIARGFASADEKVHDTATRLVMVQGLIALLAGWLLRLGWRQQQLGLALMLAGAGLVVTTLWLVGRRVPHTTYRREEWTARDSAMVLSAALTAAVYLFAIPGVDRGSIFYYPYPILSLPSLDPIVSIATLGLLGPAVLTRKLPAVSLRRSARSPHLET
jgi:energy-coupling factor transport system permease protein